MRSALLLVPQIVTCYKQLGSAGRHNAGIRNRAGHCHVTVQRYGTQIQDGGSAHPHVHGKPYGAPHVAEDPHLRR
jgi:hypothetical protein